MQTYQDLQIVVIDDGSKDSTWRIMQEYAERDSRIEIYHQENQGVAATRNALLRHVKGDWVLFVDADDWLELSAVSFLQSCTSPSVDVVSCDSVNDDMRDCSEDVLVKQLDHISLIEAFLRHTVVRGQLWNKLFRTTIISGLSFNPEVSYGEDALFCWQAFQRVNCFLYTNKQLYHYRMNDSSISHASFGPLKMSAHYVWESITSSTFGKWPTLEGIARARWGMEDALLLRSAAHSRYPFDNLISTLQQTIKQNLPYMRKSGFVSRKWVYYAFFASMSYTFAGLL